MWPFKSVSKLRDSGLFEGFTDWHSHLLPSVDDGIRTMTDTLGVLRIYEELGVKRVWLTPHIMEECPNTTDRLKARFDELMAVYNGPVELRLASENMIDSLFEERIQKKDFLPIGEKGEHLLVETSYVNPPFGMDALIEDVRALGYTPILAHPERYRYMDKDDYYKWKDRGLLFQMNYMSLIDVYGETARKKAEWLLKEDMIDLVGGDIHRLFVLEKGLAMSPKKSETLRLMVDKSKNLPIV